MGLRVELQVTEEDKALGVCGSPTGCAVAIALRRAGFGIPWVSSSWVTMTTGQRCSYVVPPPIAEWIRRFDRGQDPPPFTWVGELEEVA